MHLCAEAVKLCANMQGCRMGVQAERRSSDKGVRESPAQGLTMMQTSEEAAGLKYQLCSSTVPRFPTLLAACSRHQDVAGTYGSQLTRSMALAVSTAYHINHLFEPSKFSHHLLQQPLHPQHCPC